MPRRCSSTAPTRCSTGASATPTAGAARRPARRSSRAISDMEGAAGTVLCPSGLSAASLALLALVKSGDNVLMVDSVYGPVRHFADTVLKRLGVSTTYFDPAAGAGIADLFGERTTRRLPRDARLADLRDAGRAGDRRRRPRARGAVTRRQHLGDAALLQAARPRRRPLADGRRPNISAVIPT